jgi:hypothetical protein
MYVGYNLQMTTLPNNEQEKAGQNRLKFKGRVASKLISWRKVKNPRILQYRPNVSDGMEWTAGPQRTDVKRLVIFPPVNARITAEQCKCRSNSCSLRALVFVPGPVRGLHSVAPGQGGDFADRLGPEEAS